MATIQRRIFEGIKETVVYTPLCAGAAALLGYTYARLTDLPPQQAAKAWAIWSAVEYPILTIGSAFGKTEGSQKMIKATLLTATSIIGIQELRNHGLIGNWMTIALIFIRTFLVLSCITSAQIALSQSKKKGKLQAEE